MVTQKQVSFSLPPKGGRKRTFCANLSTDGSRFGKNDLFKFVTAKNEISVYDEK